MGIINTNCCCRINNNLHNEVIVPEDSNGNQITGFILLKEIQPINDISNCFDFIISGQFYLFLFKISSPQCIIDKSLKHLISKSFGNKFLFSDKELISNNILFVPYSKFIFVSFIILFSTEC